MKTTKSLLKLKSVVMFLALSLANLKAQSWLQFDIVSATPPSYDTDNGDPFGTIVTNAILTDYLVNPTQGQINALSGITFSVTTTGPGSANDLINSIVAKDGAKWEISFSTPVSINFYGNSQWAPGERVDTIGPVTNIGVDDPNLTSGSSFIHNATGSYIIDPAGFGTGTSTTGTLFGFTSTDTVGLPQSSAFEIEVYAVPEPSQVSMLLLGLGGVLLNRRRSK